MTIPHLHLMAFVDGMCWNGHKIDRYKHSVTNDHGANPEFTDNPASTQLHHLKNAINHLRNAYNGQDVVWSEQMEPYYGSGAEDDDEGSGLPTHAQVVSVGSLIVSMMNMPLKMAKMLRAAPLR